MPRAKANPDTPAVIKAKTPAEAVELGLIDPSPFIPNGEDREPNDTLQTVIENADEILTRKREVLEELGNERELATLLIKSKQGSREQIEWVLFNMPRKTRKGSSENGEVVDEGDEE